MQNFCRIQCLLRTRRLWQLSSTNAEYTWNKEAADVTSYVVLRPRPVVLESRRGPVTIKLARSRDPGFLLDTEI